MLSNDTIMKSYEITGTILRLSTSVSEKIGEVNASFLVKTSPKLRKKNRIKTIHSSLKIEGNTLSSEQMTALLENKRVLGPAKDIAEVQNAISVYNELKSFQFDDIVSFLNAHQMLLTGLINTNGKWRKEAVGIMKGAQLAHLAPPAQNVPYLMEDLFHYLKNDTEIALVKSCVFHYEMEFIHPFTDGNGRMGRLWQTVILMSAHPIFEFIPFEALISETQSEYYSVLSKCDKAGNSTAFIEYMLRIIEEALSTILNNSRAVNLSQEDRLNHFVSLGKTQFSRKDYMRVFKTLSTASASRDLKKGIEFQLFLKSGEGNQTIYSLK